ncbi:TIGR03943 family protein [Domibacillus iocasae]|uniref:TIGR03943 family protein n=1 Tax=Domibacillus iocasae TaxID=1714016 RepID=A0A1E7DU95_9BACI|nr:TIGR03943 family protein [Domibacillus iocasae]
MVFPLLTGFLLPPQTLGALIAAKKGTVLTLKPAQPQAQEEAAVDRKEIVKSEYDENMNRLEKDSVIQMEDDVFEPYYGRISTDPQKYVGRTIKMTGFIYKEEGFQSNQLALTRFLITHCIADAASNRFLTEFDEASAVEQDTWLEIEGTIELT